MAPPDVLSSQGRRQITAHAGDAVLNRRNELRRELLKRRRSLSPAQREQAAYSLIAQLRHWRPFFSAKRIASYFSVGAEIPTGPLNDFITESGKSLYLPCLQASDNARMRFRQCRPDSQWVMNRYGIPEPSSANPAINPAFLDIILVPLVGFDSSGNRMGMGAGYYDRSIAFRRHRQHWRRPRLIGLAYGCQQLDALPVARWDMPLDAVITEITIHLID